MSAGPRVALLWHQAEDVPKGRRTRLDGVFRALTALGCVPEAVVYADDIADATRDRLLRSDGVLVWVNPITAGLDRSVLDGVLRDVAATGVWVSAHPDVVNAIGTKEVLYRTRTLGWGSDVRMYDDVTSLREALPSRLASGSIVLKRARGNGGLGVWKVELATSATPTSLASIVHSEHAHDGAAERLPLDAFLARFGAYLDAGGRLIEQPFFARVAERMVRCYLSGPTVAGFAEHVPRGFVSPQSVASSLGFDKVMYGPDAPAFRSLRRALESDWVPSMQRLLGLDTAWLPAIWDADFIPGPKTSDGEDTWVLCEINASCVSPFPDEAAEPIAWTAYDCVTYIRSTAR